MPSRGIDIGDDPVNLGSHSTLDLDEGTNYTLQNKSEYRLNLYQYGGAGTPSKDSAVTIRNLQVLEPYKSAVINIPAGETIFAWLAEGLTGTISIVEAI